MSNKNILQKVLVAVIFILAFFASANAEVCSEQLCVNGTCQIIPKYDLPGCDHPDDNFSVSNFLIPMTGYNYKYPEVITFLNGYHKSFSLLVDRLKKGEAFTDVQSFAGDLLGSSRLLVIPSGGLNGLENSQIFRALLDEFVKQGGILLVFGQQHGYSFSALPTPVDPSTGQAKPIASYGWTEDQSCTSDSVYIDAYHQALSGQSRSTPSLNVDGYFLDYPADATILLRRRINSQPAMLMYDYGQGKVIVTSMYSDWAFGNGQASQEEISLVRDLISWAKSPDQLPEIKAGETVAVPITLINNASTDATSVKIVIYNPDKSSALSEQTVNMAIPAGSSSQTTVQYSAPVPSALGIYHVEYSLLDAQGNVIQLQAETDTGRFAVSSPAAKPLKSPDFSFAVNSNSENFAYSSDAVFTITMFNNTDKERSITAKYFFPHHYWETGEAQYGGDWSHPNLNLKNTVVIPPKSSANFTHVLKNARASIDRLWAYFYDVNNNNVGMSTLGFYVFRPSVNVTVRTDKTVYNSGESVSISLALQNKQNTSLTGSQMVRVVDSSNIVVYTTTFNVKLSAYESSTQNASFALPSSAKRGFYTIVTDIYDNTNNKIGGSSTSFEIPLIQISVTPILPPVFNVGVNTLSFNLANVGKIAANTGTLNVSLKAPDGSIVTNASQPFTLDIAQNLLLDIPLTVPSLSFGSYTFYYSQSDEGKSGNPVTKSIPNTATLEVAFDKPTYRLRDTANLEISITNTGVFLINNANVTASVPDAGYSVTKTISVLPNETAHLPVSFIIPASMAVGQHNADITITLPSGSSISKTVIITVPKSDIKILYQDSSSLLVGDTINLIIENNGGNDTNYTSSKVAITDSNGVPLYNGFVTGTILAGESKNLIQIQIPSQIATCLAYVTAVVNDDKTGKIVNETWPVKIVGISATLQTKTDKESYLKTESITGETKLENGQLDLLSGVLNISVSSAKSNKVELLNKWGSYGGCDGCFDNPFYIAVAPDSSVYVVDTFNHRIQKFDSNGNFLAKWGNYVNGVNFYYPHGISVAPDGSIYVADSLNNRIQKLDNKGNLIAKWGSYGRSNGQFINPTGIAVDKYGFVYVSDTENHRIQKFGSNGSFISKWGGFGSGDGQFYYPGPIDISSDGSIFVGDLWNQRVQKFDSNGNYKAKWGSPGNGNGQFSYPGGIAVDSINSYIYVSDTFNNRIEVFDKDGNFVTVWGSSGNGDLQFQIPRGLAIATDGSIYVVEQSNNRIQKLMPALGTDSTLYKSTITVTQPANTIQNYLSNISTLNTTGKLYLNAELMNDLGQTIDKLKYPFYIIEGNTTLHFMTDKKFYKPGETVTITGEVKNLATITASGLSLILTQGDQTIYTTVLDLPSNGSYPFTVTTLATAEGVYNLAGTVAQNGSKLVGISDQYEVAIPKLTATMAGPDVVGNDTFKITLELNNDGKTDAVITVTPSFSPLPTTVTIPAGQTKLMQYDRQISFDVTDSITIVGDLSKTLTKPIKYGLADTIAASPEPIYPEGKIAIPVTIINAGSLDTQITVNYQTKQGAILVNQQAKNYFLPKGGNLSDTLYYDVTEGSYQLTSASQLPTTTSSAVFTVRKETKVDMMLSADTQLDDQLPISVNISNLGYNPISGSVLVSLVSSEDKDVWSSVQEVSLPFAQAPVPNAFIFNLNLSSINPGNYTIKAELFNAGNQRLATQSLPLSVPGAVFAVTQTPSYQTFQTGTSATMAFKVKNAGTQDGAFDFNFKADDLIDSTRTEWLKPGEEKEIIYHFMLPADSEAKDYFASYTLKNQKTGNTVQGLVKYHLAGINLTVEASLDKTTYNVGDTAILTLVVSQDSSAPQNLFAKVNYNGYEDRQTFTISTSKTLTFSVPLYPINGAKLTYGVYYESGRSIHLNSVYIYKTDLGLMVTTDKQVYNPGETVIVSFTGNAKGELTFSGPGDFSNTFAFTGSDVRSFNLPATMTAGTYMVSYTLTDPAGETIKGSSLFDVMGIQVKVKEATLDKKKCTVTDTMKLNLIIESNQDLAATLKTWVVDPSGNFTSAGQRTISLIASAPLSVTYDATLVASSSGTHRLVYGIFLGSLPLSSGSVAFDVGDATLISIATDKANYPYNNTPVTVTVSMFGTSSATLELFLDGTSIMNNDINLAGFGTSNFTLQSTNVATGFHILKAVLTAGDLTSTKETTFTYGSHQSDLKVNIAATPDVLWPPNHQMVPVILGGEILPNDADVQSVSISVADEYGKYSYNNLNFGSAVMLEAWRDGNDKDGRIYSITAVATDMVGNTTTKTTTVVVPHDMSK